MRASRPTFGRRSAAVDMSTSELWLELSCEMASLGDRLIVEGVEVLGSVRSGFDCPGVAAAPGSGVGTVCATAVPHMTHTAATQADGSFGFMMHILQLWTQTPYQTLTTTLGSQRLPQGRASLPESVAPGFGEGLGCLRLYEQGDDVAMPGADAALDLDDTLLELGDA